MNHPWCKACDKYDSTSQACTASACMWKQWANDIVVDDSRISSGGTGVGFPAIMKQTRGWMKAQEKGKTGGYSWEQTRKAFSYEVAALRYLKSLGNSFVPHIQLDDQEGEIEGSRWVYYVMSTAQGTDIDQVAKSEIQKALFGLCEALVSLHRCGFGHFDLKPQNIIYNSQTGKVTLIDLGSSKGPEAWRIKSEKHRNHPVIEGNRPGTFPYVSPEHTTERLINLTMAADDYVYGILFCQGILGCIVERNENRSLIYRALLRKGVAPEIAECVAFRLLSTEISGRRNALEALFGMMIRRNWNEGRNSSLSPVQVALPKLSAEVLNAVRATSSDSSSGVRGGGTGVIKKIAIVLGIGAIAAISYFAGGGGKSKPAGHEPFFPGNSGGMGGGGMSRGSSGGGGGVPRPRPAASMRTTPSAAVAKSDVAQGETETKARPERVADYCEFCGEELVFGECKKTWLHVKEYTDLWQKCVEENREFQDFRRSVNTLETDIEEATKTLESAKERYQEISQTTDQLAKQISTLELKMAESDEELDRAYSRNRKEKTDESRKAFEEAQAENDRIAESLRSAKDKMTKSGQETDGREVTEAKESLDRAQKVFDEKNAEFEEVSRSLREAEASVQKNRTELKETEERLHKAHEEELLNANIELMKGWKEELNQLFATGDLEQVKDELRKGFGDGQDWKHASSLEFYLEKKAYLMPKIILTNAPKGAKVRINDAKEWTLVAEDGSIPYSLPKDWNGHNLDLRLSCMAGDCDVCSEVKELAFTGDRSIHFFGDDYEAEFPSISLKNDPTYKIEVTPFDAKVVCRVANEEKEITMGQLFTVPAHEDFQVIASKDGYVEQKVSFKADHRGTQGKVLPKIVLQEGRSEISVLKGVDASNLGDYAYDVEVKKIFIVDKDNRYTDAEILERVGATSGMSVVHLNGVVQNALDAPISGVIESKQFEVLQPISGVSVTIRSSDNRFECVIDPTDLQEGSCFVIDRLHYFTKEDLQSLFDAWLANEQYLDLLKEMEAQWKNGKPEFRKVAENFYAEHSELQPTYTIRTVQGTQILLEKNDAGNDELFKRVDWGYSPKLGLGEERDVTLRVYRKCDQCGDNKGCSEEGNVTFHVKWSDREKRIDLTEGQLPKFKANPLIILPKNAVVDKSMRVYFGNGKDSVNDRMEGGNALRVEPHNGNQYMSFELDRYERVAGVKLPALARGEIYTLGDIPLIVKNVPAKIIFQLKKEIKDHDVNIYVRNKGGNWKSGVILRNNLTLTLIVNDGLHEGEFEYGYSLNALPPNQWKTASVAKSEVKSIDVSREDLGLYAVQEVPPNEMLAMIIRIVSAKIIASERDGSEKQGAVDWLTKGWSSDPKVGAGIKLLIAHIKTNPQCEVALCSDVRTRNIQKMSDNEVFEQIVQWCKGQSNRAAALSNATHDKD